MFEKELKRITSVDNEALEHVVSGDYRKAQRVLRKIENSFCFSESMQVSALIHAEIHFAKGELKEMADLIRANLCYLWGIYDGWELLSRQNPAIDADSQVFFLLSVEQRGSEHSPISPRTTTRALK